MDHKATHQHLDDARAELSRRLRGSVDDDIWAYLVQKRWPQDVLTGEGTYEELVQEYRELSALRRRRRTGATTRREIPPDQRLKAIAARLGAEAAEDSLVRSFRDEVLKGRLIAPQEVASWIEAQAAAEGEPTPFLHVPLPPGHEVRWGGQRWPGRERFWPDPPLTISQDRPATGFEHEQLVYPLEDGTEGRIFVHHGGVLSRLRSEAYQVASAYGWREAQGVLFVLTGIVPEIPRATASYTIWLAWPGFDRIKLDLDATLSAGYVARLWRQLRREFPLRKRIRRYRAISEKHVRLAEFYGHASGPWRDRLRAWNEAYPDWAYSEVRNFARDCRHAWRRIFEEEEER